MNSTVFNWLAGDWNKLLGPLPSHVALALAAMVSGAIIGLERQKHEKPAGLRTLILVCLGSAGFTMAGFAFTSNSGDSGRVAAQIVTGIGFLGAGVILHPRGTISGATTAATIWVTASVGMMAGAGYAGGALAMAILVRFILVGVGIYEWRLYQRQDLVTVAFDFDPSGGRTRVRLEQVLIEYSVRDDVAQWKSLPEGMERVTLQLRLPRRHLHGLLDELVEFPEVKEVHRDFMEPTASA